MSVDGGRGEAKGATENVHSFVTSLCGGLPQDNSDPEQFLFIKNVKLRGAGQEIRFFGRPMQDKFICLYYNLILYFKSKG